MKNQNDSMMLVSCNTNILRVWMCSAAFKVIQACYSSYVNSLPPTLRSPSFKFSSVDHHVLSSRFPRSSSISSSQGIKPAFTLPGTAMSYLAWLSWTKCDFFFMLVMCINPSRKLQRLAAVDSSNYLTTHNHHLPFQWEANLSNGSMMFPIWMRTILRSGSMEWTLK